jgi:hypothetical protein
VEDTKDVRDAKDAEDGRCGAPSRSLHSTIVELGGAERSDF